MQRSTLLQQQLFVLVVAYLAVVARADDAAVMEALGNYWPNLRDRFDWKAPFNCKWGGVTCTYEGEVETMYVLYRAGGKHCIGIFYFLMQCCCLHEYFWVHSNYDCTTLKLAKTVSDG